MQRDLELEIKDLNMKLVHIYLYFIDTLFAANC